MADHWIGAINVHECRNGPAERQWQHWTMNNLSDSRDYFVGWFTLSLINAGLAQGKGRSGLNWWLLSLFLGPVGTFLLVILDPVRPVQS